VRRIYFSTSISASIKLVRFFVVPPQNDTGQSVNLSEAKNLPSYIYKSNHLFDFFKSVPICVICGKLSTLTSSSSSPSSLTSSSSFSRSLPLLHLPLINYSFSFSLASFYGFRLYQFYINRKPDGTFNLILDFFTQILKLADPVLIKPVLHFHV
ncbi:MAG: hypothetical protein JG782_1573, partial [Anaerophaga sp.]|nr:hypothetical protein [Anaerophaga sp.]